MLLLWLGTGPLGAEQYAQPYYGDDNYLAAYRRAVLYYNPSLDGQAVDTIVTAILHYSYYYRLDPRLVVALVACESGFRPGAVSPAGARGLGQLMPETARGEGVNPASIVENIHGSCRVLRRNLDRYRAHEPVARLKLALAAYNAGPGAVERYGGIPPYPETQAYVKRVLAEWRLLCGQP
jgi:soluble lytic murein transglycosylase-like protein